MTNRQNAFSGAAGLAHPARLQEEVGSLAGDEAVQQGAKFGLSAGSSKPRIRGPETWKREAVCAGVCEKQPRNSIVTHSWKSDG